MKRAKPQELGTQRCELRGDPDPAVHRPLREHGRGLQRARLGDRGALLEPPPARLALASWNPLLTSIASMPGQFSSPHHQPDTCSPHYLYKFPSPLPGAVW